MHRARVIVVFIALLLISYDAGAMCRRIARVKHQTELGWSKLYTMNVVFLTGNELNTETCSYEYSPECIYAIIFCFRREPTIIKLSSHLLCSSVITCDYFDNILLEFQGYDLDGDKWSICVSEVCF